MKYNIPQKLISQQSITIPKAIENSKIVMTFVIHKCHIVCDINTIQKWDITA